MSAPHPHTQFFVLAMLFAILSSPPIHAGEWVPVRESPHESIGHDAFFVSKKVKDVNEVELKMVVFNESQCVLRVIAQQTKADAKPVSDVLRTVNALAGTNGGYFDPSDLKPTGLEIASGKATGKLVADNLYYGSLAVLNGKASLLWHNEVTDTSKITELVQCTPKLVDRGIPVTGISDATSQRALRTFIATDGEGKWALGTCTWIRLGELGALLTSPKVITELRIIRALNMDGGPSTGLWWRNEKGDEHYDKEGWKVRNIVAILPRK